MAASFYAKRPLGEREIRVLEILPGQWMEQVQCKLHYQNLDEEREPSQYRLHHTCLSYVWGTHKPCIPIDVDGEAVLITPNLDRALRHFRRRMKTRNSCTGFKSLLWADSVCINQLDREEQSRQVAMMNDIFTLAQAVFVFLGDGLDASSSTYGEDLRALSSFPFRGFGKEETGGWRLFDEALDTEREQLIEQDGDTEGAWNPCRVYQWDVAATFRFFEGILKLSETDHVTASLPRNERDVETISAGLQHLIDSAWWERAWTTQEGVVGIYPTFIVGACAVPWKLLRESAFILRSHFVDRCCLEELHRSLPSTFRKRLIKFTKLILAMHQTYSLYTVGSTCIGTALSFYEYKIALRELFGYLNRTRTGRPFAADYLLRLLQKHRARKATDPRDKIFAILPLAKLDSTPPIFTPNYSNSFPRVSTDTARIIISESGYLDILAIAAVTSGNPELPSWVPDWSSHANLEDSARISSLEGYSATLDRPAEADFQHDRLIVKGTVIGKVQHCGRGMIRNRPLWKTIHSWVKLAERRNLDTFDSLPRCSISWNELCRTLHGDTIFINGTKSMHRMVWGFEDIETKTTSPFNECVFNFSDADLIADAMESFFNKVVQRGNRKRQGDDPDSSEINATSIFTLTNTTRERAFIISDGAHFGLAPAKAQRGDKIAFLQGSRTPHILRSIATVAESQESSLETAGVSTENSRRPVYQLIGDCYLHGFMDGELDNLMDSQNKADVQNQTERLIWQDLKIV